MTDAPAARDPATSLYDRAGGASGIAAIANRFYDLIEQEPEYAELRAMHAPDLLPIRVSLTEFLSAWLGGPRTWFEERPGRCIMSAHRAMDVTQRTAAQWVHAMSRALAENRIEPALGRQMQQAFLGMANGMIPR
ncbi:group II truncated hemoglobin [Sphingomonas nostoxanthinifaciens]|uniref:group II truncated hemoglobin n=1 Tax=Sphingomonas nostoxanthinifaciens TaxID=2872652 RepID=UPI001CC1EBD9|nr:group II truncated hemoglobin [Sphingomonas nostoxanthinifaciens]UAK23743.1 group II truncated hemoglobin [Sphingomonas nostoxanthinifaciens]